MTICKTSKRWLTVHPIKQTRLIVAPTWLEWIWEGILLASFPAFWSNTRNACEDHKVEHSKRLLYVFEEVETASLSCCPEPSFVSRLPSIRLDLSILEVIEPSFRTDMPPVWLIDKGFMVFFHYKYASHDPLLGSSSIIHECHPKTKGKMIESKLSNTSGARRAWLVDFNSCICWLVRLTSFLFLGCRFLGWFIPLTFL